MKICTNFTTVQLLDNREFTDFPITHIKIGDVIKIKNSDNTFVCDENGNSVFVVDSNVKCLGSCGGYYFEYKIGEGICI